MHTIFSTVKPLSPCRRRILKQGLFAVKGAIILAVGKSDEVFTLAGQSTQLPRARFLELHSHATYYDGNVKIGK